MQKLLLLHGALGSEANFNALKEILTQDFEVYTMNFNGHGNTIINPQVFSISGFADEVLAFMDKHQFESVSVFGYSMGGYVGLYLAKHFPNRIDTLFTLATKLDWTIEGATRETKMLNPETIEEKVPKYAVALQQLHGNAWKDLMYATAQMMVRLGANPQLKTEDFKEIQIPIRMAVGDKDAMVTIEETLSAYRAFPNAELLVMPNTIHPIDRVNAEELAHHIRQYFL